MASTTQPDVTGNPSVMTVQPTMAPMGVFVLGPDPSAINCPNCRARVITAVDHQNGPLTWLVFLACCICGCWIGCCCIPFCTPALQDSMHKCPNCHSFVGRYRRM